MYSTETGPYPSPKFANCSRSFSHFSCKQPLCESTRDVFEKQTQKKQPVYELCSNTKSFSYPAYNCVFKPPNSKIFEKSKLTPPLGLRVLPLFQDLKIDLGVVDDVTVSDTLPWSQPELHSCLSLTKFKKGLHKP